MLFPLVAEEVVTTKKGEPDAYFGLKVGAIVSPTLGYRFRDKASGTTNINPNERQGFSLPWTQFHITKEWEEKGIKLEFWGEVLSSSTISADTQADRSTKSNAYLMAIRRANVQKTWDTSSFKHTMIFGMQELPHMHSVWSGSYDWRYIERSPLESLSFARDPVDLGISYLAKWKAFSLHTALVNGDGYRSIQNTTGTGFDVNARLSWESEIKESLKLGIHLLGRKANAFGASGSECLEGRTNCLASDNNPNTNLRSDIRLTMEEVYAIETNLIYKEFLNLGFGGLAKKRPGGNTIDLLKPYEKPSTQFEKTGRGAYVWLGLGNSFIRLVLRGEAGTGTQNLGVSPTESKETEPWVRFSNREASALYSDKSYFVSRQVYAEYLFTNTTRIAIGYSESRSYNSLGEPNKIYVDQFSGERTRTEYVNQGNSNPPVLISEYGRLDRALVLKATMQF